MTDTAAWLKPGFEAEVEPRRCSATTKAGKACTAYAMKGKSECAGHSGVLASQSAAASAKSAEVRKARVEQRKEAKEAAKLGVIGWMERLAGEHDEQIARAALARALDGDVRMLTVFLERIYGKVADHVVTTEGEPYEMDIAQLNQWLHSATEASTVPEPQS